MATQTFPLSVARRPRGFVGVSGPHAEEYLQRMLSNDIAALGVGDACEALLLTAKARVIAPLVALRRAPDDFLLLTEPELRDTVVRELTRMRFAARCEIHPEEHRSFVVLGDDGAGIPTRDYGVPAVEVVDAPEPAGARALGEEELELLRIRAGTPRWGREIDDRVLPAEAGLVDRAVSFTKGCYPGQEPIARLHYRGHANRELRVLALDHLPPAPDAELRHAEKVVGRVTSAARAADGSVVALGYVRVEVPADAELEGSGFRARQLH